MAPSSSDAMSPFESASVVDPYEDWLRTPYGRFVERVEVELLLELLAPLEAGANVLDIGCGTGWVGERLRERGLRVVGVEPSAAMASRASSRLPLVRGDALHLPFADRAFDAVYLTSVLDFVPDPAAVLREARRVARERVAVIALASRSWLGWRRRLSGLCGHPVFAHTRFYSRGRLLDFARAAGAEPERVRGALFLPPSLAPFAPGVERASSRRFSLGAGWVAFALPAGSVECR
ncbi:MAG: class I SAM-dependent methyltransferase [Planctomycetes bacterium]|nr:class I SAM-dependent methyltransferase [Planctomycetota bacterium]